MHAVVPLRHAHAALHALPVHGVLLLRGLLPSLLSAALARAGTAAKQTLPAPAAKGAVAAVAAAVAAAKAAATAFAAAPSAAAAALATALAAAALAAALPPAALAAARRPVFADHAGRLQRSGDLKQFSKPRQLRPVPDLL